MLQRKTTRLIEVFQDAGVVLKFENKSEFPRWLSNWMTRPIFLLGYRPTTFDVPPPTRRTASDERMAFIDIRALSNSRNFWNQISRSASVSMRITLFVEHESAEGRS